MNYLHDNLDILKSSGVCFDENCLFWCNKLFGTIVHARNQSLQSLFPLYAISGGFAALKESKKIELCKIWIEENVQRRVPSKDNPFVNIFCALAQLPVSLLPLWGRRGRDPAEDRSFALASDCSLAAHRIGSAWDGEPARPTQRNHRCLASLRP